MMRAFDAVACVVRIAQGFGLVLMLGLAACQPVRPVAEVTPAAEGAMQQVAVVVTVESTATPTLTPMPTPTVEPTLAPIADPTADPVADPVLMAAGLAVYRAQYCGVCHELAAAGTTGTFGPSHNGLGATADARLVAADYTGAAATPAEYIYESIVTPELYIVPTYALTSHRMPPYGHLPAADLAALVAFLAAQ